ncbi:MAG: nucleoside deaminase [Clostridia bacterium]|nr:nucleoside deaminase [Clostridia bacterium]
MTDKEYMDIALDEAVKARMKDEVPVGAIIVRGGKVIAKAHNLKEHKNNACAHAEMLAIKKATRKLRNWRLSECEMYVTLEPCPMCAGAIMNSRIRKVVIGTEDPKAGSYGGLFDLNSFGVNHKPEIVKGVSKERCAAALVDFFQEKRGKRKDI